MAQGQDLYVVTAILQLNNGACLRIQVLGNVQIEKISISCLARLSVRKDKQIHFYLKKEKGIIRQLEQRVEHGQVCMG